MIFVSLFSDYKSKSSIRLLGTQERSGAQSDPQAIDPGTILHWF